MSERVLGWGIEAQNGTLWPETLGTRNGAIAMAETLAGEPWAALKKDWGLNAVKVCVRKCEDAGEV